MVAVVNKEELDEEKSEEEDAEEVIDLGSCSDTRSRALM